MKKLFITTAIAATMIATTTLSARAETPLDTSGMTPAEAATTRALVDRADSMSVVQDKAADAGRRPGASPNAITPAAPFGSYPSRKGVILVTPDKFKGLIPTGHAAIIYSSGTVVEALSQGVVTGSNNWRSTKSQAYGVTVKATTGSQDATAATWAYRQLGKPYNYNYLNTGTRSKFYCSHLVWASFLDNFRIDLNTPDFFHAVHPMELVNTSKTSLVWRKK